MKVLKFAISVALLLILQGCAQYHFIKKYPDQVISSKTMDSEFHENSNTKFKVDTLKITNSTTIDANISVTKLNETSRLNLKEIKYETRSQTYFAGSVIDTNKRTNYLYVLSDVNENDLFRFRKFTPVKPESMKYRYDSRKNVYYSHYANVDGGYVDLQSLGGRYINISPVSGAISSHRKNLFIVSFGNSKFNNS